MRIGTFVQTRGVTFDRAVERVRAAAAAGLSSAHFSHDFSWHPLTLAGIVGQIVQEIDLGTAVVPSYAQHPLTLAEQALSVQAATGNRLTLGIGPSHLSVVEGHFGYSYHRPARHVREYLSALGPLLRGDDVDYRGETLAAAGRIDIPGSVAPVLLISALGPVMLQIAGELTDGTVTMWTTADTIAEHVAPAITRAASAAGRPAPQVVAIALACVTSNADAIKQQLAGPSAYYTRMPTYQRVLERQRMTDVRETVIFGDEATVAREIRRYAEAGATELAVSPLGDEKEQSRTLELLGALARE
jgi:F420-dependent oxidoreductase-like protein